MSGRRDSNPRPSAWKADALPTELLPLITISMIYKHHKTAFQIVGRAGFEPTKAGPADLQSALVDRLSISPSYICNSEFRVKYSINYHKERLKHKKTDLA